MSLRTLGWVVLVVVGSGCGDDDLDEARLGDPGSGPDAGVEAGPRSACDATRIERCQVGRCIVSAPRTTLGEGEVVELVERSGAELGADPLPDSSLCEITLPERFARDGVTVTLTIELATGAPTDGVLFRSAGGEGIRLAASAAAGSSASGLLGQSGLYGVTRAPGPLALAARLVGDPQRSDTPQALLRNVSSTFGRGVTWDGTHTYVASGQRVLMYRGLPTPHSVPELVLGQPSLDVIAPGLSASQLGGVTDIWTDGHKLAIANDHRVLLWREKPTSSFAPADVVIGQRDFVSAVANAGGISASSMQQPWGLDSDGTRLLVAELRNGRVLSWDHWPDRNGEPATGIIGAPTFTEIAPTVPIYQARGVALDGPGAWVASYFTASFRVANALAVNPAPSFLPLTAAVHVAASTVGFGSSVAVLPEGRLALSDGRFSRVDFWRTKPTAAQPVDFALGQVELERVAAQPPSASSFSSSFGPEYLRSAPPYLFVGDTHRVLVYERAPRYFFEPADRVIGQAGFSTSERGLDTRFVSERALGLPTSVATSAQGMLVADRGNNRVLFYPPSALGTEDPAASVVLGQPDATSVVPNVDQISPSASTLSGPTTALFAGSRVVVADTENHRVLVWNTLPQAAGAPADLVLGQASMTGRKPNRDRGDLDEDGHSDASLDGMFYPTGLASDGTRLFVSDRAQHRILVWDTFPTQSGQQADRELGQSTGSGVLPNRGQGSFATVADGLFLPTALVLDGTSLFVADTENNRVLRWDDVNAAPTLGRVYGQVDGSSVANANVGAGGSVISGLAQAPATAPGSVLRPVGLAVAGGRVFVSERDSNRVHVFERDTGAEVSVLGHATLGSGAENDGGVGARSLASPAGLATDATTLWIADSANHRVVGVPLAEAATTNAAATRRIGQASWSQNGYSRSLPVSAGGSPRPSAVALTPESLYVAETSYNRVLVYDRGQLGAGLLQRIYGQPDATSIRANGGGAASAGSLAGPRGVFVGETMVFVADTENSRVLVFDRGSASRDAIRVIGQADFTQALANRGGGPDAATLSRPEGVSFDGTRLYVADTGNHRVLVWNTLPTVDGAPADAVLGQIDAAAVLGNQGGTAASAATLSSPTAVLASGDGIFVADTQNNRVLRFAAPFTTGQAAAQVLGQASATERVPASSVDDLTHDSGPVSLATDGVNLYVAERDARRILVFRPTDGGAAAVSRIAGTEAPGGGFVSPLGLALERTPLFTSRLVVADGDQSRVLVLDSVSRLREP